MNAATLLLRRAARPGMLLAMACAALTLSAGCASEPLMYSGFIGDYSQLARDADRIDQAAWRDPAVDLRNYRKVMIDPPVLYYSEKAKDRRLSSELKNKLEQEMRKMLTDTLAAKFQVVEQPGPDTLRVRAALTELIPTDKRGQLATNEIVPLSLEDSHMESEALDSMTAQRVAAMVDSRQGRGLSVVGGEIRWEGVRGALRQWSQNIVQQLSAK